ncbi:MAG: M20 family metallopeptidase [Candidatus Thermoplasmatota archaeon]|jgi:acetylornithine deacetylase/succinyl-diaminopimelate desuccinylase-like protein|nr:M20 family metallopeptidase [Candidatus Thermoplasmatota archaeon]MCL5984357.1 M20 family metallopeptidase [Candidatus Thermoplasmatota archaeon]
MLTELIGIPSDVTANKREIIDYIQYFADRLKMTTSIHGNPSSPAILAESGDRGVVLSGHLDTPPIGDFWNFSQGQIASGRMYGRGAADMKGSIVAMLQATQDLVHRKIPVVLAFTTDEETTMAGAASLAKTLALRRARAVVIGEPTALRVGHAEKGVLDVAIETKGKAAHGAMPQLGDNAVTKMMRLLKALEGFKGKVEHSEMGRVTVNPAVIQGGTRVNVVPSRCVTEVDIRFPPPYTPESLSKEVEDHLHRIKTPFTLRHIMSMPALHIDPNSEQIRTMVEVAGSERTVLAHASEAVHYLPVNPHVVIFGAGSEELAHQTNEYVKIEAVMRAAEIYKKFAQKILISKSSKK